MSISYQTGDMFAAGLPALAHGCNCDGVMGAGVAKAMRDRWPHMYDSYRWFCQIGQFTLGSVFTSQPAADVIIFNLAIQQHGGPCAVPWAIGASIYRMIGIAEETGLPEIGMPRIGCGIGGLDWDQHVGPVVESAGRITGIRLIVFTLEPVPPAVPSGL